MDAIRTEESNFTYVGPRADVADLPCRRESGRVYAVFAFSDEEREMIANGAQVEIGIWQEPIPPLSVKVVNQPEAEIELRDGVPVSTDFRCVGCHNLYVASRAIDLDLHCGWCGGELRLAGWE